ncbi:40s ribosomal protein s5-1 [Hordeum vulgare]|nr:40s ribosomal protein s5-1 [Hordeum vulgare]
MNPYLLEVMKHPQAIEMRFGVLHCRDIQGPKMEGSEKARLVPVEQKILKCQGVVERGFSADHSMIKAFTRKNKMDNSNMGEALFKLQERIGHLQAQMFDLQNQNCEYGTNFKSMRIAVDFRTL